MMNPSAAVRAVPPPWIPTAGDRVTIKHDPTRGLCRIVDVQPGRLFPYVVEADDDLAAGRGYLAHELVLVERRGGPVGRIARVAVIL